MPISFMKVAGSANYSEVNTYADLPAAVTAAGMTMLVLQETGTWILGTLKRAGLYYSDGSTWTRLGNAQNFFYDDKFAIKNSSDTSKQVHIDASGITTATARTLTIKDADGTPFIENVSGMNEVAATEVIGNPEHMDNVQKILNHMWSSGVTHGCELTDNGDGTVSFASGYATLRPSADAHTTLYMVEVQAQSNLTLTDLSTNYIYLDYNSGNPQFKTTTSIDAFNCLDKCITYVAVRVGNDINYIDLREQNVDLSTKSRRLFLDFARFIPTESGNKISEPSPLTIAVTAGAFYMMIVKVSHSGFDTSIAGTANENVFKLHYRDGLGGWTSVADQKIVDTTTYDGDTGTPVTLDNNKFGVTWFYICNNSPSMLCAVMGQSQYANLAEAQAATPPEDLPPIVEGLGALVGFVVYEKSATSFDDVLSSFDVVFASSTVVNHNGLSGLQGGTTNEYYHLTNTQHSNLTTNNWSLGTYNTDGTDLSLDVANYITITIGGTPYKLAVLT